MLKRTLAWLAVYLALGLALVWVSFRVRYGNLNDFLSPPVAQHEPWASGADPATRPWATRDGTTITLHPSGATFRVSPEWVSWNQKFKNNFHLTHAQLDAVARGAGDWDAEYASVCNAALPFDRCAAHVGGEGWGGHAVSWSDLQVRVYDLGEMTESVEGMIARDGEADVERFLGVTPTVECDANGDWGRTEISFDVFYGDYGGTAHVDFRVRRGGERTYVFVFMHAGVQEQEIKALLDSFTTK